MSPALAADFFTTSATWEAPTVMLEKSYVILGLVFWNKGGVMIYTEGCIRILIDTESHKVFK